MTKHGYNSNALILKAGAMDELADEHPVAQLMRKPNTYQTENDFRKMAMMFLKLTGMAPVYANTGAVGSKPLSIHVLPTQWVTLVADQTLMDAAKVYFSPMGGGVGELERAKVYLWKYQNPDFQTDGSHLYGLSPLKAALLDMQGSIDASKQQAKMYQNGGARGVFSSTNPLNETQFGSFQELISNWANGTENKGKVNGFSVPVTYHDIGLTSVDMELLKGRQMTDERIANVLKYPPELLKADNKYDNVSAAMKSLVTNGIYSDLVSYRDFWNQWLLPMFGASGEYYVDFDISVLPEMQQDMEKVVTQAKEMWWITPNEKRQLSKYDDLADPAMNAIYLPTGLIPISEAFMPDVQMTADYQDDTPQN
jgi:HK97 family phage portal protein